MGLFSWRYDVRVLAPGFPESEVCNTSSLLDRYTGPHPKPLSQASERGFE
jgi:hypothetical protein